MPYISTAYKSRQRGQSNDAIYNLLNSRTSRESVNNGIHSVINFLPKRWMKGNNPVWSLAINTTMSRGNRLFPCSSSSCKRFNRAWSQENHVDRSSILIAAADASTAGLNKHSFGTCLMYEESIKALHFMCWKKLRHKTIHSHRTQRAAKKNAKSRRRVDRRAKEQLTQLLTTMMMRRRRSDKFPSLFALVKLITSDMLTKRDNFLMLSNFN